MGRSAAGRIMSMKNSNDTIGNRTRSLPNFSAVSQPTAPPRTSTPHPPLYTVFVFITVHRVLLPGTFLKQLGYIETWISKTRKEKCIISIG